MAFLHLLWLIGLIKVCFLLHRLFNFLFHIYTNSSHKTLLKRYGEGSYALVTGASDGIGFGYCRQLALLGFNLVMQGRNKEKLEGKAKEIQEFLKQKGKKEVDIRFVVFDFESSQFEEDYVNAFLPVTVNLDISLLVNNAGFSQVGPFREVPIQLMKSMIDVNVIPPVILSKLYLPVLIERNKEKGVKSGLIQVSSTSACAPLAGHTTYAGTKVFDDFLAKAIYFEEKENGIESLSHRAGLTQTKLVGNFKPGLYCVTADEQALQALKDLESQNESRGPLKSCFYHLATEIGTSFQNYQTNKVTYEKGRKIYDKVYRKQWEEKFGKS